MEAALWNSASALCGALNAINSRQMRWKKANKLRSGSVFLCGKQCCVYAGPVSRTLEQHLNSIGSTLPLCWVWSPKTMQWWIYGRVPKTWHVCRYWPDSGPASQTMGQLQSNIGSMFQVCMDKGVFVLCHTIRCLDEMGLEIGNGVGRKYSMLKKLVKKNIINFNYACFLLK